MVSVWDWSARYCTYRREWPSLLFILSVLNRSNYLGRCWPQMCSSPILIAPWLWSPRDCVWSISWGRCISIFRVSWYKQCRLLMQYVECQAYLLCSINEPKNVDCTRCEWIVAPRVLHRWWCTWMVVLHRWCCNCVAFILCFVFNYGMITCSRLCPCRPPTPSYNILQYILMLLEW